MGIKRAIFASVVAALISLTVPALARNFDVGNSNVRNSGAGTSDGQRTNEPAASSSCSALQQTADGSWARLPCQELGSPPQDQRKSVAHHSDRQPR